MSGPIISEIPARLRRLANASPLDADDDLVAVSASELLTMADTIVGALANIAALANPLIGQGEDFIWRPANEIWKIATGAKS